MDDLGESGSRGKCGERGTYQLGDLLAGDGPGVGHRRRHHVQHVVQLRVPAGGAAGGVERLRGAVLRQGGDVAGDAVGRVLGRGLQIGDVEVGVDVERDAANIGREQVVGGGVVDGAEGGRGGGGAGGGVVGPCVLLHDGEGGVGEGGVAEAEAELVDGCDAGAIEGAVVDEDALGEVELRHGRVGQVQQVGAVVLARDGHGEGELGARVDAAV